MVQQNWMTLVEYSNKYDISISTLRRRIKNNEIAHQSDNGKYLVEDIHPKDSLRLAREQKIAETKTEKQIPVLKAAATPSKKSNDLDSSRFESNEAVFTTANRLLDELKKAYSFILQEKEEQIIALRSELSDLKTLVRVLEDELDRKN
jgi:hypothetical protein